jgi:hypothetical protein
LPRRRCIWRQMIRVLSRVLNCSLMGAERKSNRRGFKANHYTKEIVVLRTTKVAKAGGASGDQSHRDLDARERGLEFRHHRCRHQQRLGRIS